MKNFWIIIEVTCKIIFCKSLNFFLRNWMLMRFLKIKLILIWWNCSLLGKIGKIRTYSIECIIFVLFLIIFSKIIPSRKLWSQRFSFDLFIFNWNKFFIFNKILLFELIRIYHTVCTIILKNILLIFGEGFDNYFVIYFCKSFIFFVVSSVFTLFIKRSLISWCAIFNSCLTKNRIHSTRYLIFILKFHKFLTFKICI